MSVSATLLSDELLLQDLRIALKLDDKDAVYSGRYPRPVRRPFEVWVETAAARPLSNLSHSDQHPYRVHIRTDLNNLGADQTGAVSLETVKGHMATIRDRFDGVLNTNETKFLDRLPGLMCWTAEEESVDEDPIDAGVLDGVVILAATVRR